LKHINRAGRTKTMKKSILLILFLWYVFLTNTKAQETNTYQQPTPPRVTIKLPNGRAADIPKGPYKPSWESMKENYKTPDWLMDAKFGIFIHYGPYTVAAYASEWYSKHMYSNAGVQKWHTEHFGPVDKFGYKDLIPLFTIEKFDPKEWAELFKKAGAKYVIPTAEHHDGFAMYDSKLTKWNAKNMGPKRDFIGELGDAVRKQGMKFGVSNHRMEHWDFMYPMLNVKTDQFDPEYADFYGPPQPPQQRTKPTGKEEVIPELNDAPQSQAFQEEWLARCQEIIDKYKPDALYFDNGVNSRKLDSIKLRLAAYYYNRAASWKKQVTVVTKSDAYLAGSLKDYERQGRAPKELTEYYWQVDDPVGEKFGYVEGMKLSNAGAVVNRIIENTSKNGNYMLNISPKSDGTIPDTQRQILLGVGKWLAVNGDGIYYTRAWTKYGEGQFRFTTKGNVLYAISLKWSDQPVLISSVTPEEMKVKSITLLGHQGQIAFSQDDKGLRITFPSEKPCEFAYTFKIEGSNLKK
jgi:alpha-L-fucosidase